MPTWLVIVCVIVLPICIVGLVVNLRKCSTDFLYRGGCHAEDHQPSRRSR